MTACPCRPRAGSGRPRRPGPRRPGRRVRGSRRQGFRPAGVGPRRDRKRPAGRVVGGGAHVGPMVGVLDRYPALMLVRLTPRRTANRHFPPEPGHGLPAGKPVRAGRRRGAGPWYGLPPNSHPDEHGRLSFPTMAGGMNAEGWYLRELVVPRSLSAGGHRASAAATRVSVRPRRDHSWGQQSRRDRARGQRLGPGPVLPGQLRRRAAQAARAMSSASTTSSARRCSAMLQPITCREKQSITVARYSQPAQVRT